MTTQNTLDQLCQPLKKPVPYQQSGSSLKKSSDDIVPCSGWGAIFTSILTWREAATFLNLCAVCPIRSECLNIVRPEVSWYDGIAGGYLWLNGRPLVKEYRKLETSQRPFADEVSLVNYLGIVKAKRLFR